MSACKVHVRPIDNEVLYSALNEVESIVDDFEMKMQHICSILENERRRLVDDSKTADTIGEIIYRLKTICDTFVDTDPSRNFTRELFNIAINGVDDGYEEEEDA